MVDAVFIFGALNVLFEFVLLAMLSPRVRLRALGSRAVTTALHFIVFALNLFIHYGTLIGTMSSILAFVCSLLTVAIARLVFGHIVGSTYTLGWVKYAPQEIA